MRLSIIIATLLACMASNAMADDVPLKLSLKDAIRMGVEKNLDVRAELYNPAQFESDINRNKSIYDLLFTAQAMFTDATTMSANTFPLGSNSQQSFDFNSSLSRQFWTGATATVSLNNAYLKNTFNGSNASTASASGLNSYWQSNLGLTINQPLLKNLGRENTEININVSRLLKFASIENFTTRLLNTVAQVRTEYFKLYSLREELEVRQISLELARKILAETKARVSAGVLPAMEILNAEFGATSREKDLIDTEKALSDQVDVLRLLLQIEGKGDILTADLPRRDPLQVSVDDALRRTMSRPDIKEQKRNLEIAELQTRVFSNRIKPDLSIVASTSLTGLDNDYPGDLKMVGSFDAPVYSIGLNFIYPFGNNAAENDYRKSRLKSEQAALQIRSLEEGAANDVKSAIRGVVSGYKQIDVADRGRAFAEERLRAFIRKNEVGLATTKDVMDVENDLVSAKNNQIVAVVNYDNAITRLWQVTGELLEREGVRVVEADADKLYANIH